MGVWGGRSGRCTGSRSPGLPQGRGIGYSAAGILETRNVYSEHQTIQYYSFSGFSVGSCINEVEGC